MFPPSSRRSAFQRLFILGGAFAAQRSVSAADPAAAVEQAHAEIWRRFIDRHGVMLDFTDLDGAVPGQPNALGRWAPIEKGAMFNGLYCGASAPVDGRTALAQLRQ